MSSFFGVIEEFDRLLVRMEKGTVVFMLFTLMMISFIEVIARNFFKVGFLWIDEFMRVLVLWLAFVGGALCSEYARHMRVDVFLHYAKGRWKKYMRLTGSIFIIIICLVLFVASIKYIGYQMEATVSLILQGVPDWVIGLIIPYFFAVTILRALLSIKREVVGEEQIQLPIIGGAEELHKKSEHV
ncbi:MAG: hypothetical protein APR62_10425 [Smithella sp. SDB]|nr:MAG: hypothetical protein APR62_10425 [Smithella sp. SDB]